MPPTNPHQNPDDDSEPEMLAADDALEEVMEHEEDVAMDSDNEGDHGHEEITLQNDSIAYFDLHKDSVFAIAQHPRYPAIVATGGSEGDSDDAPGKGYILDTSAAQSRPLLPPSYNSDPGAVQNSTELQPLFTIEGHTDSINALLFTQPNGDYLVSGGMDGRLRAYSVAVSAPGSAANVAFLAESQEVPEINWLSPCPSAEYPNTIALGASDGSVWVYTVDAADAANPLQIVQSYFLHTGACTAGAWTPDGQLLATVSEDSSLYVWDVWGAAAARSLVTENGQTAVSLTAADQRFEVEGGLYSVAVAPTGTFLAAGGAGGAVKIVGLPRLSDGQPAAAARSRQPGRAAGAGGKASAEAHAGAILASLHAQSDGIEALAFAPAPATLLAAGSVDGSVAVYDTARGFGLRRHLRGAHDEFSVVQVEFVRAPPQPGATGWMLTSCGMDGVVRRWDLRGAATSAAGGQQQQQQQGGGGGGGGGGGPAGLAKEWRGHRGDGEGGGVLGFVQGETGERVVTAGDDGVVLVFEA